MALQTSIKDFLSSKSACSKRLKEPWGEQGETGQDC